MSARSTARSFFVPETLQTSGMDCGPAALRSLLAGLAVRVSYERLRDACSTSADGTSIDAMEELCAGLGLEAFQEIAPVADAVEVLARRAPAIVVVQGPGGAPHFVLFWRALGPFVQLMDPARGRRWVSRAELERDLYLHSQPFDDETFRAWFPTTEWKEILDRRCRRLGVEPPATGSTASEITSFDGAVRLLERLVARGAAPEGQRRALLRDLVSVDLSEPGGVVPPSLTSRRVHPDGGFACRGCVFLVVRRSDRPSAPAHVADELRGVLGSDGPSTFEVLTRELSRGARRLTVVLGITAILLATLAFAETVFLRAAFHSDALLSLPQQRFAGAVCYGVLVASMLALELVLDGGIVRLGRSLELRFYLALLKKLPRLPDRYFRTRPMSDVAHRSQGLVQARRVPELFVTLGKQSLDLVVTASAISILYPRGIPLALLALLFGVVVPYVFLAVRKQVEARVQAHASGLGQLYLDVLLGLAPIRTHGAQLAVRSRQGELLVGWRTESERSVRLLASAEAVQSLGVLAVVVALLLDYLRRHDGQTGLLLLAFWVLRLPLQARALSASLQRVPGLVAAMGRLVEPLTAAETEEPAVAPTSPTPVGSGLALDLRGVSVVLGAREVLSDVSLSIASGEHVAVVGTSGAGKSSLLAVLLGLLEPRTGRVFADGEDLGRYGLQRFRRETVWVDPTVQVWNRSMLHNLQFGNPAEERGSFDGALEAVDLKDVVERLPAGFATSLGEGGARLSGGEGQRVRIGRALLRRRARLVLLDEAFRGLDRRARRDLSRSIRRRCGAATVLEVTHDVADTGDFDRVVVIEEGKVVEQGAPATLLATAGSRYAELVDADASTQRNVWDRGDWKLVVVEGGRITSRPAIVAAERDAAQ